MHREVYGKGQHGDLGWTSVISFVLVCWLSWGWVGGLGQWGALWAAQGVQESREREATSSLRRWGVVELGGMRGSGKGDLLTVELSRTGMEMLERGSLKEIEAEQLWGAFGGSGSRQAMVEFGERLRADVLVLVSVRGEQAGGLARDGGGYGQVGGASDERLIRVEIYACRVGVRLALMEVVESVWASQIEELVAEMARVRERFAGGIERVYAIAPFVSENLERTYEGLGERFHDLLAESLSAQSGVAIGDYERSEWLAEEWPDEEGFSARFVPWLVEMEYYVEKQASGGERIRFRGRRRNVRNVESIESPWMEMEEAARWIVEELGGKWRGESPTGESLGWTQQVEAMSKRLEFYERLGDFRHAVSMGESMLLMGERKVWGRRRLIEAYRGWCLQIESDEVASRRQARSGLEPWVSSERMEIRRRVLGHFAWLVKQRELGREEAFLVLEDWVQGTSPMAVMRYWYEDRAFLDAQKEDWEWLVEFWRETRDPFWSLRPERPRDGTQELEDQLRWSKLMWGSLLTLVDENQADLRGLLKIAEAGGELEPDAFPTCGRMLTLAFVQPVHSRMRIGRMGEMREVEFKRTAEEVNGFYAALDRSSCKRLQWLGRWRALQKEWAGLHIAGDQRSNGQPVLPEDRKQKGLALFATVQAAREEYSRRPGATFAAPRFRDGWADGLMAKWVELERDMQRKLGLVEEGLGQAKKVVHEPSMGRMGFEPLALQLGSNLGGIIDWIVGTSEVDWIVCERGVVCLSADGEAKDVLVAKELGETFHAIWDQALLHVQVKKGDEERWIVFEPNGQEVGGWSAKADLPSHDLLRVWAGPRGHLLFLGMLANGTRSWVGVGRWESGKMRCTVLHEGRRPMDFRGSRLTEEEQWQLDWVCDSRWGKCYEIDGEEKILLSRVGAYPLWIDFPELTVRSVGLPTAGCQAGPSYSQGEFLFVYYGNLMAYRAVGMEHTASVARRIVPWEEHDRDAGIFEGGNDGANSFVRDGMVYVPGYVWYRFDGSMQKRERLVPTRLPHEYGQLQVVSSKAFGMVGYQPRAARAFRITIAERDE